MICRGSISLDPLGPGFVGTNKSKTFELLTFALKDGQPVAHGAQSPATTVLSFGSGEIAAKIASDEVQIGAVKAYLKNGVLLMAPWTHHPVS